MKPQWLTNPDISIRFCPNVSYFVVNDRVMVLKYENKLFRVQGRSAIEICPRLFYFLQKPRKITELLVGFSDFKKKDILGLLLKLYLLHLIEVSREGQRIIADDKSKPTTSLCPLYPSKTSLHHSRPLNSHILLVGHGILFNNLNEQLKKIGVRVTRIQSFAPKYDDENNNKRIDGYQSKPLNPTSIARLKFEIRERLQKTQYKLFVVAEDYANHSLFEYINMISLENKAPCIRVSFDGPTGYLGPFVYPGKSCCYYCCEMRLVNNSPDYEYFLWHYRDQITRSNLYVSANFVDVLTELCVQEIIMHLENVGQPETLNNLLVLDTKKVKITKHKISAHPSCGCCRTFQKPRCYF